MADYSLVPVDYQPDFGNVSLVPVDHDPFGADGVTEQVPAAEAQTQPQQLVTTIGQPNVGASPSDAPTAASSGPDQPNGPSAAPISSPGTPAPANQQQPSDVSAPGSTSGGDSSSFGKRLVQGVVDTVPGAHYARLAQEQFRQGNYGAAAFYETLAFGDAALGVATLGASSRLGTAERAVETALTAESLRAGRAAAVTAKEAAPAAGSLSANAPTSKFYSVLHETRLRPTSYPGSSRPAHYQEANEAFLKAMEGDAAYARDMQNAGVDLRRTATGLAPRTPPAGFSWHHAEEPGVMQLVPRQQHDWGSIFQDILHPDRGGGFSKWGK